MGIIAGIILIGIIVYTVVALNRQKKEAEAEERRKEFKGTERNDSQKSRIPEGSPEEEDVRDRKK